jgi:hypothetical protein
MMMDVRAHPSDTSKKRTVTGMNRITSGRTSNLMCQTRQVMTLHFTFTVIPTDSFQPQRPKAVAKGLGGTFPDMQGRFTQDESKGARPYLVAGLMMSLFTK